MDFSDVYGRPLFDTREWKTVVEQGNPISNPLFMVLLVISAVGVMSAAVAILITTFQPRHPGVLAPQTGKNAP